MVSEQVDPPTSMSDDDAIAESYIRMQGVLRGLCDQLRQITARSAADFAEIKQAFAASWGTYAPDLQSASAILVNDQPHSRRVKDGGPVPDKTDGSIVSDVFDPLPVNKLSLLPCAQPAGVGGLRYNNMHECRKEGPDVDDVRQGKREVVRVRSLSEDDREARNILAKLGATSPLVGIVVCDVDESKINALNARLNLGIGIDENREAIVKAGVVHRRLEFIEPSLGDSVATHPMISEAIVANFLGLSAFDSNIVWIIGMNRSKLKIIIDPGGTLNTLIDSGSTHNFLDLAEGCRDADGIDGNFDNNESKYEETFSIIVLPNYVALPFSFVELPEKVRLVVDTIRVSEGTVRKEQIASWVANKKQIIAYAVNLQQIDNGVVIPHTGWKCAKGDKTDNLWLNLTDGTILYGKKNWDGTGGNNHTGEYYMETSYSLAMKLGTVTTDSEGEDVFSYPEDEGVEDPHLAQHLASFGNDFTSLQKTEMTTAERELDQNTNFDWNRIQEGSEEVGPLFGPGYTGLVNLGNRCYMAATMQVIFSIQSFCSRYHANQSLKNAFERGPVDSTVVMNMQLTNLALGLLSGKYSILAKEIGDMDTTNKFKQEGIQPRMFKAVIAANHPEPSTKRQQDALEFFLYFLDQVERSNGGNVELDSPGSFKCGIENHILCPSGKVAYIRVDYILSLNIPLQQATNNAELQAFQKFKTEKASEGKEVFSDEVVWPMVPLEAWLTNSSAPEEVLDFYSTTLQSKTTAIKTTDLTSFPDYLIILWILSPSPLPMVDQRMKDRNCMLEVLKHNLQKAQQRMKVQADKRCSEQHFEVGNWVYVKLQPYRQRSLLSKNYSKSTPLYCESFQIQQKVGQNLDVMTVVPVSILDHKVVQKGNRATTQILVQWSNGTREEATWESYYDRQKMFPDLSMENLR